MAVLREIKDIAGLSRAYRRHAHDELAVAHVWSGATVAWIDGVEVPVSGTCVVVIRPGVAHACNPEPGSGWAYTQVLLEGDLPGLKAPYGLLPSGPALRKAFQSLRSGGPCDPAALLAELALGEEGALPPRPPVALRRAMEHLRAHLAEPVELEALAAVSGLSKYHLLRLFRQAYGLTPHACHLNLRVNEAKVRLARGEAPARVAAECGFCDQGHLTRVFARHVGLTPAEYRRAIPSKTGASRRI